MKTIQIGEYTCKVGGNAKENWELLRKARKTDYFFHLSSLPSCYVILESDEEVPDLVLLECSRVCLYNTKYRDMKGVDVDCILVNNVRRGEKIGEVYYSNSKKVRTFRV